MSDSAKLVVHEDDWKFRLAWEFEDDIGGTICDEAEYKKYSEENQPEDRETWECWIASTIAKQSAAEHDSFGFYWKSLSDARKVLNQIKLRFKQDRPLPEWAKTALAAGWKAPKGWKA